MTPISTMTSLLFPKLYFSMFNLYHFFKHQYPLSLSVIVHLNSLLKIVWSLGYYYYMSAALILSPGDCKFTMRW
jgi:hypothetical protein